MSRPVSQRASTQPFQTVDPVRVPRRLVEIEPQPVEVVAADVDRRGIGHQRDPEILEFLVLAIEDVDQVQGRGLHRVDLCRPNALTRCCPSPGRVPFPCSRCGRRSAPGPSCCPFPRTRMNVVGTVAETEAVSMRVAGVVEEIGGPQRWWRGRVDRKFARRKNMSNSPAARRRRPSGRRPASRASSASRQTILDVVAAGAVRRPARSRRSSE